MGNMLTAVDIDRIGMLINAYKKLPPDKELEYLAYREEHEEINEWDCMEQYMEQRGFI